MSRCDICGSELLELRNVPDDSGVQVHADPSHCLMVLKELYERELDEVRYLRAVVEKSCELQTTDYRWIQKSGP